MTNKPNQTKPTQWISDKGLAKRFEVSRATIWRWTKEGHLPQPKQITPGCTRWNLTEIEEMEGAA